MLSRGMEERAGRGEGGQSRQDEKPKKEKYQSVTRFFPIRERGGTIARGHDSWRAREHEFMRT